MFDFDKVIPRRNTGSLKWDVKEGELPMWVADMDFACSEEILKALSARAAHGIYGYTDISDEWYDAYIGFWERRHSFKMERDSLLYSTGVVPAIASMIRYLTAPGEKVLLMSPVYNIFFNIVKQNDRFVSESKLLYDAKTGRYSIDFEDLDAKLKGSDTRLMIFCNPQNPAGRIWTSEELAKVGSIAASNGVVVISDEIHCDITRPGTSYVPFASVNHANLENSITCISPTKAFNIAGIQSACCCVKNEKLRAIVKDGLNRDNVNEPNVFSVPATVAAFNGSTDWLDEMREYVFENRRIAEDYIKKHIACIKPVKADATYLMWADIRSLGIAANEFTPLLRAETGLFITPGNVYGEDGADFVRINLACPRSLVIDGLERLKKYCDRITEGEQ